MGTEGFQGKGLEFLRDLLGLGWGLEGQGVGVRRGGD